MLNGKPQRAVTLLATAIILGAAYTQAGAESPVRMWEQQLIIPTYSVGAPDPNPRFYDGRAYQGAQGRVYPYPMLDNLTDERVEKAYKAVYLENEYVKICVLPGIGGRVFSALDKTNGYDFLYRQHVIKPALIGMLGAWISGGIEWNFPHHHRATVFMPMDYMLLENRDGSKTIWMAETELRHRMRWTIGITLWPGKSYFEVIIKPYNGTPLAHSFLYWANVSVHANEHYQVIFPPSTEYTVYHGKSEFAHWPVSHEVYRKVDYTKGVDLSWWKNHPSPMSFFAWNYDDDFLAGYDHGKRAGTAYVADHHIAPGKKFWEWGPGPRGRIWDKILTDDDGPYLELMVGGYSDNQPDYSWLQPYEGKVIEQYWYPMREMGGAKSANLKAAVSLEVTPSNTVRVAFNATSRYPDAKVVLQAGDRVLLERAVDISPARPFHEEVPLPSGVEESDLHARLLSSGGEELVAYKPAEKKGTPMPDVVEPPPPPEKLGTVEDLYFAGLRLEQFYNPALAPDPYYEEALKRDPADYRANLAMGLLCLRKHLLGEAEERFRVALERSTGYYTRPRDGEAYYYMGLVLKLQGKHNDAYDAFQKAAWSYAFHSAAYYHLAEIACLRTEFSTALEHIDRSVATNAWNAKAFGLKSAILRRLGRPGEAAGIARQILASDPLDLWAIYEHLLAESAAGRSDEAARAMEDLRARRLEGARPWFEAQPFLEVAVDYGNCGLWDEAIGLLSLLADPDLAAASADPASGYASTYPMVHYYLGYFHERVGDHHAASRHYQLASEMPPEYCFPFRVESIRVLHAALRSNPGDACAHYYLGNLLYDHQKEEAIREWERSMALDDRFATVHRNLAMAYYRVERDIPKSIVSMERAVACDNSDPRLFYELDILCEAGGVSPEERLALLEKNLRTVAPHNDAFSRVVVLLTQLGRYDKAIDHMKPPNHFRRWEGLGNIHTTYVDAHLLRGLERMQARQFHEALQDCKAALLYPENLEVARPHHGGRECQVYYFLAAVCEAAGDEDQAASYYRKADEAKQRDTWSELRFYRGAALAKLGREEEAGELFDGLIQHATEKLESASGMEFFAKFGKQLSQEQQTANAHYLLGLGYLGKGELAEGRAQFEKALSANPNHLWARTQLSQLE